MGSRQIEHTNSQTLDIARRSSRSKPDGASPIHPGMASRTNTMLGGPTQGNPPDGSSPNVTDPSRQGKSFAVPAVTFGHKSDAERGRYDPGFAEAIMSEAYRAPDDYAKSLHTVLPGGVSED